jgi:hypothetical protein
MRWACLAALTAAALFGQQFKLNLDHLAAKASDSVDVSLGGPLLQLGAKFLDNNDPDEAKVKKMIAGIEGIYVRHFEFKKEGQYSPADVDGIRAQLKPPDWSRIVGWKGEAGENAEVYLRMEGGKMTGVAIIDAEATELTVVNIVGPIDLELLADLGGHFNVPKIKLDKDKVKDKLKKK